MNLRLMATSGKQMLSVKYICDILQLWISHQISQDFSQNSAISDQKFLALSDKIFSTMFHPLLGSSDKIGQ